MSLEGTLKDFRLSEIIQLIGQQNKTGILTVSTSKKIIQLYFLNGNIIQADSDFKNKKSLLGEMLVKAKVITRKQLERALKKQEKTLKFFGEILIDTGALSIDELRKALHTQILDAIQELFTWKEGHFRFDPRPLERERKIYPLLNTEQILLNVSWMMDEWPEIERKIPFPYQVLKRTSKGRSEEELKKIEDDLTDDQKYILSLIDGKKTVEEIVDQSLMGRFNTYNILASLWDMGLIEKSSLEATMKFKTQRSFISPERIYVTATVIIIGILAFFVVSYFNQFFTNKEFLFKKTTKDIITAENLRDDFKIDKIKNSIKLFYLNKGYFPKQLKEVVEAGFLKESDIFNFQGKPFLYIKTEKGFSIKNRKLESR